MEHNKDRTTLQAEFKNLVSSFSDAIQACHMMPYFLMFYTFLSCDDTIISHDDTIISHDDTSLLFSSF